MEGPETIVVKHHKPGRKHLHRKSESIKFNGKTIASSELANKDKNFNNVRNDKNIMKRERLGGRGKR